MHGARDRIRSGIGLPHLQSVDEEIEAIVDEEEVEAIVEVEWEEEDDDDDEDEDEDFEDWTRTMTTMMTRRRWQRLVDVVQQAPPLSRRLAAPVACDAID